MALVFLKYFYEQADANDIAINGMTLLISIAFIGGA